MGDLLDFSIDGRLAFLQFGNARARVQLGAVDNLAQQIEHRHQARFGADELALPQRQQPVDGLLGGRGEVIMGLVLAARVIFAQPAALVGSPVVQICRGRLREEHFSSHFMQVKKVVIQLRRQLLPRDGAHVRRNETMMQEAGDHRSVIGCEQAPGRMSASLRQKLLIVHK